MNSIAVFYASEGTGHRTAAQNLAERFKLDNPDGKVVCADILDCVPRLLHFGFSNYYLWTVRFCPRLWGKSYYGSDHPGITKFCCDFAHKILCKMYLKKAETMAREIGAQAVFFTHYFGAEHYAARNPGTPVFFVNTDFETHIFQRAGHPEAFFVPSETAVRQYAADGIKNVYNTGIPIADKFSRPISKTAARELLGIEQNRRVILVSGGGIGAGNIQAVAASLSARKDWQTIIICGNNKALKQKLEKKYSGAKNMRFEGFVENIEQFYRAADLGIIKPGGLTLAETLASELPLLLMDAVPGQEECNMRCVCEADAAVKLDNARCTLEKAAYILDNPQLTDRLRKNAQKLSKPFAAGDILKIAETFVK